MNEFLYRTVAPNDIIGMSEEISDVVMQILL